MDSFEWNKVSMAVLSAALTLMLILTFTPALFEDAGHGGHGEEPKLAYKVDVPEAGAPAAVVEEGPSLAELMATADAGKGARQFAKCKACHTLDKGGKNGVGPNLYGILGKAVAATDGYGYSSALTAHGGAWSYDRLDAWLQNPKTAVPGNKMAFAGLRKPQQRADLILYLRDYADTPLALPAVEVEEAVPADAAPEEGDAVEDVAESGE